MRCAPSPRSCSIHGSYTSYSKTFFSWPLTDNQQSPLGHNVYGSGCTTYVDSFLFCTPNQQWRTGDVASLTCQELAQDIEQVILRLEMESLPLRVI